MNKPVEGSVNAETAAQKLARWVVCLRYEDLPPDVVLHAKRCMLDTLGVQIRGATLPWIQPVYQYVRSMAGSGPATVTYYGDRVPAAYAAYANSASSYSCELQHSGVPESAHPGVIVIPTAQAVGEQLGSTGKEIIAAMVAGYEVQGALGMTLFNPAFHLFFDSKKRNFHTQGLLGAFSAAATAGKLLGLNEEQLAHALAIAGSHASGMLEYDQSGGEVKRIHGAMGARSGIQSALLAKAGFTGPLTVFEGRHGFFAAFGGCQPEPDQLFRNLGERYCITRCRFRIYPTIGTQINALDIFDDLIKQHAFSYRDVEKIRVGVRERSLSHITNITRPHDVISAQASLGFSLGLRLVKGSNKSLEMYINPELWRDPEVLSIADRLEGYILENEAYPRLTRLEVVLKNGQVLTGERQFIKGSETLPFSQQVIADKFRGLASVLLPQDRVDQIMETVERLDQLPSIARLVPLLQKQ